MFEEKDVESKTRENRLLDQISTLKKQVKENIVCKW